MANTQQNLDYEQIALGLNLEEEMTDGDGAYFSPEEARRRSEAALTKFESGSPTSWFEDYRYLRSQGWNWRLAVYIAWASSPKKSRYPATQMELAKQVLGLTSDRVINTWRKKNPAIDDVIAVFQSSPLFEHRRDFYDALIRSATDPDYKHHPDRKMALEMLGDYVPRMKVDVKKVPGIEDIKNLSDEELMRIAKASENYPKPEKQLESGA